jgi:hypothetical protein
MRDGYCLRSYPAAFQSLLSLGVRLLRYSRTFHSRLHKMDKYQQRIEAAYLAQCTAQAAYDWLDTRKHHENEMPPYVGPRYIKVLEYILVRRLEALIDLGIARFGKSTQAIRRVYQRGTPGDRHFPHRKLTMPMRVAQWPTNSFLQLQERGCCWDPDTPPSDGMLPTVNGQRKVSVPCTPVPSAPKPEIRQTVAAE